MIKEAGTRHLHNNAPLLLYTYMTS